MTELGLFVPENPVTYSDPLTAFMAAHATPTPGSCDFPGAVIVVAETRETLQARQVPDVVLDKLAYGLPPQLAGRGLIPYLEWRKRHGNPNPKKASGTLFCNYSFGNWNPYVDEQRGAVLYRDGRGAYYLGVSPCLVGFDVDPWPRYDIDGNHICDLYQTIRLQDDTLQDLHSAPPDPLAQFGRDPIGDARRQGPGGLGSVTVAGIPVADVLSLLGGLGGKTDLSGVLQVLAALVVQGANIRGSLDQLPAALGDPLGGALFTLSSVLADVAPDLSSRLTTALDQQTQAGRATARDQAASWPAVAAAAMSPMFGSLVGA